MRTRHPFADIEERLAPPGTVLTDGIERWTVGGERPAPPEVIVAPPARGLAAHRGENRRQRRRAVATFAGPKELGPGLRRDLLEKRQAKALGTLDPALRRLQRKALSK